MQVLVSSCCASILALIGTRGSPLREQLKLSETNEKCSENLKKAIDAIDALEVEVKRLQNRVAMQSPIIAELQQDQLQGESRPLLDHMEAFDHVWFLVKTEFSK